MMAHDPLEQDEHDMLCRECGCTDGRPCMTDDGPCGWSEPGLCTACDDPFPNFRAAGFEF
jgi:hypothetical protein